MSRSHWYCFCAYCLGFFLYMCMYVSVCVCVRVSVCVCQCNSGGSKGLPGQIAEAHHLKAPLTEGGRGRHPGQELKARHPFTSAGRFVGSFPPLSTLLQGAAGDGLPA